MIEEEYDNDDMEQNLENTKSVDENGPLKKFIDNFKQKYNIQVEPNDIAIFV